MKTKLIGSAALLAVAAGAAGLGTFGSFTSSTSAGSAVGSGTFQVVLGAANTSDNRLSLAANNVIPSDNILRPVTVTNTGTQNAGSFSLTTTVNGTSSKLDSDPTNGLQMTVLRCTVPWNETGSSPSFDYSCPGDTYLVIDWRPVIGTSMSLSNVAQYATVSYYLLIQMTLPSTADNSFQGISSTINFEFDAVQRAASTR